MFYDNSTLTSSKAIIIHLNQSVVPIIFINQPMKLANLNACLSPDFGPCESYFVGKKTRTVQFAK